MRVAQTLHYALRKAGLDEATERKIIEDPIFAERAVIRAKLDRLQNLAARLNKQKHTTKQTARAPL